MWDNYFEMLNKMNKLYWATYFGQFHSDGANTCLNCGGLAYKYYENKYNGYRGKCPACDVDWPES